MHIRFMFLKSKLCVSGVEIVDLENLEMKSLLDSADTSFDFLTGRGRATASRPIAIFVNKKE